MAADPLRLLVQAVDELDRCVPLSADVHAWLLAGLRRGIDDGVDFAEALGLVEHGRRSLRARLERARADAFLSLAVRAAPAMRMPASDWHRCCTLAPLVERYSAGSLRHDLRAGACSSGDPWRVYAFHAAALLGELPTSPEGLWGALKRHRGNSQSAGGWTLAAHYSSPPPCKASPSNSSDRSAST